MRHATLLVLAAVVGFAAPVAAQCTGTAGTDFQQITIREMNALPQENIDQLNAAGAALETDQIDDLARSAFEGQQVELQAVILSDPLKSGLATANDGIPGRIHVFIRDVAAETEGVEGMGSQIVDGRGDGAIQQFFVGDEVTVCADVTYFRRTLQLAPVSITSNDNPRDPSDPILDPVVATTGDIHNTFEVDGVTLNQIDWNVYSDFVNQYVRFENAELVQGLPGTRPNILLSSTGEDAQIRSYDTSVCFRNDRDETYFPANQEPACNQTDFVPPPTGVVNVQGFLTLSGPFDAFGSSVPADGAFAISPIEASDFEIAVAPPVIAIGDTPIATTTDGAIVRATIVPTSGNTIASVVADFTTTSGASGQVVLENTSGDDYEGAITGLTAGDFVTYTITATDSQSASSVTSPVTRRVLDGPVSSIFDIQATPDGGAGASGITTAEAVPFDLDATVQSTFSNGSNFFATIQDDESLAAFTGVWVFFGSTDPGLTVGDQINISAARVSENFDLTQLSDVTFTTTGSGDFLGYKEVTTDLFNGADGTATAEQHEGMLLSFDDVTVVATNADDPSGPFGEFLFSSDGTVDNGVRADDLSSEITFEDNDPGTVYTAGGVLDFIRGPLYFSFSNYKLTPTSAADIGGFTVDVGEGPGQSLVAIESAFPNPTTGTVRVRFALATPGTAVLRAFDATGRQVATLADGEFSASTHEVSGSLEGLATGVYLLRLEAGGEVVTSRVAVVR